SASAGRISATWRCRSPSTTRKRTHGRGRRTRCASRCSRTRNCWSTCARTTATSRACSSTGKDRSRPLHQQQGNRDENKTCDSHVRRVVRGVGPCARSPFIRRGIRREEAGESDRHGHEGRVDQSPHLVLHGREEL